MPSERVIKIDILPLDPHPPQKGKKKERRKKKLIVKIKSLKVNNKALKLKVFSFGQAISPSYVIANGLVMLDSK